VPAHLQFAAHYLERGAPKHISAAGAHNKLLVVHGDGKLFGEPFTFTQDSSQIIGAGIIWRLVVPEMLMRRSRMTGARKKLERVAMV
jgi:hypothetical protein